MACTIRKQRRKPAAVQKRRSQPKPETNLQRTRRPPPQICKADESKVGFGDIPAELRNQIYEAALVPSDGASIRIVQIPPGLAARTVALGLLASCKAVRREAWSFFYERKVFRIDCLDAMTTRMRPGNSFGTGQWQGHLIINGYDRNPKLGVSIENYEADLSKFFYGTNYKRGLQSIRSISLAYYVGERSISEDESGALQPLPERADLVLVLKLLSTAPFFSVNVDHALSNDQRSDRRVEVVDNVRPFMGTIIDPLGGPQKMCKDIMVKFVEWSRAHCYAAKIGQ